MSLVADVRTAHVLMRRCRPFTGTLKVLGVDPSDNTVFFSRISNFPIKRICVTCSPSRELSVDIYHLNFPDLDTFVTAVKGAAIGLHLSLCAKRVCSCFILSVCWLDIIIELFQYIYTPFGLCQI